MKTVKFLQRSLVMLASLGMLIPQICYGVESAQNRAAGADGQPAIEVTDVALASGGVLRGQVIDTQGTPVASTRVVIGQRGEPLSVTQTNAQGEFAFSGLKGGVYQMATSTNGGVYRLWATGTAPPVAQADALMVHGDKVVRGQRRGCCGYLIDLMSNPWFCGALVATAITVPLILDDDDDAS
jgi:hypothetical protein